MPQQHLTFGPFVLDSHGTVSKAGAPVQISTRGVALLRALLEADGGAVTKASLMEAAWPSTSVEESNLTVQIAALRKTLGASAGSEDWIATVPRVGYRFVRSAGVEGGTTLPNSPSEKQSIAVLPFANMSSDPEQEYFADGLAEDLISDLSKVPGLVVIARNSSFTYKGKPTDLRAVARDLGVRYVVEGSVRRAAARVRVSAQLIDTTDNHHLWVDRFDRDIADIFALQDEIVGRIVHALTDALPPVPSRPSNRTANLEAYDLFVRGRILSTQSPVANKAARPLLEKAIELDPTFAEAHAWLALSHAFGWAHWGEPRETHQALALVAAQRAVSRDRENAEAHTALGYVLMVDGKPDKAAEQLGAALRINPNHADAWSLHPFLFSIADHRQQLYLRRDGEQLLRTVRDRLHIRPGHVQIPVGPLRPTLVERELGRIVLGLVQMILDTAGLAPGLVHQFKQEFLRRLDLVRLRDEKRN
jgi:TolB-like protein